MQEDIYESDACSGTDTDDQPPAIDKPKSATKSAKPAADIVKTADSAVKESLKPTKEVGAATPMETPIQSSPEGSEKKR